MGETDPPDQYKDGDFGGTNLSLENLEGGRTYFWSVNPMSSFGVDGIFGESIWSFSTVDFGADISAVETVSLEQGEQKTLSFTLRNTGTLDDNFTLTVVADKGDLGLQAQGAPDLNLDQGDTTTVNLLVDAGDSPPTGEYRVTLVARSQGAKDMGYDVDGVRNFTVLVKSPGDSGDEGAELGSLEDPQTASVLVLVIAAIVAVAIIMMWTRMKKKKYEADKGDGAAPQAVPLPARATPMPRAPQPSAQGAGAETPGGPQPMPRRPGPTPRGVQPSEPPDEGPGYPPYSPSVQQGPGPRGPRPREMPEYEEDGSIPPPVSFRGPDYYDDEPTPSQQPSGIPSLEEHASGPGYEEDLWEDNEGGGGSKGKGDEFVDLFETDVDVLAKLKRLRDQGEISPEEYEEFRRNLG
jgi:hypothetical protein